MLYPKRIVLITLLCSYTSSGIAVECLPWGDEQDRKFSLTTKDHNLVIGEIYVNPGDIFDSTIRDQDAFIHSAANALHIKTKSNTIITVLPFKRGDSFSSEILEEGERSLRTKRYLRDAQVRPVRICAQSVDIEIRTVDNWTLTPSVSFGSAGGVNKYAFEIHDSNVLGLGKEIKIRQARKAGEESSLFVFSDDNVLGSRHQLQIELGDTDDGESYSIAGGQPFYANASEQSWWVRSEHSKNSFQSRTVLPVSIPVESEVVDIRAARRQVGSDLHYARLGLGFRFSRQLTILPENTQPEIDDTDFEEWYPFVTAQWAKSDWIKQKNYQSLGKTEDVSLGYSVDLEAGLILDAFGNDDNAFRLDLSLTKGWQAGKKGVHLLTVQQVRYFDNHADTRYSASVRYQNFYWLNDRRQLDLRLLGETNSRTSPIYRFKVGGDNGLRAYPNEYQQGENRILAAAELRHVNDWTPFSLVKTAWTVFAEAGKAWSQNDNAKTLANVGFGLSFSPTRGSKPGINRFDISFPLVDRDKVESFQIFVGSMLYF